MRCASIGVPVYNDARAIERSVDKSMTSLLLHAAGIPTPPTWATESAAQAQRIVMRESAAGHARGAQAAVRLAGHRACCCSAWSTAQHRAAAFARGRLRIGWPTCSASCRRATQPGFDWRVLVVGGRAIAAMRRVSEHWIHNVAQGARCEAAPS